MAPRILSLTLVVFSLLLGETVRASFHAMQIEQVIGGVNGDTSAQAIQLRMRSLGQNFVASSRLQVVNATGASPVLLENMATNVAAGAGGSRVLL